MRQGRRTALRKPNAHRIFDRAKQAAPCNIIRDILTTSSSATSTIARRIIHNQRIIRFVRFEREVLLLLLGGGVGVAAAVHRGGHVAAAQAAAHVR